jgi:hypothetical protein
MIAELRGGFLLVVSLVFFMAIIGLFALSAVMRPSRWSERPRPAS